MPPLTTTTPSPLWATTLHHAALLSLHNPPQLATAIREMASGGGSGSNLPAWNVLGYRSFDEYVVDENGLGVGSAIALREVLTNAEQGRDGEGGGGMATREYDLLTSVIPNLIEQVANAAAAAIDLNVDLLADEAVSLLYELADNAGERLPVINLGNVREVIRERLRGEFTITVNYNPDQARDDSGKWTDGGGGTDEEDRRYYLRAQIEDRRSTEDNNLDLRELEEEVAAYKHAEALHDRREGEDAKTESRRETEDNAIFSRRQSLQNRRETENAAREVEDKRREEEDGALSDARDAEDNAIWEKYDSNPDLSDELRHSEHAALDAQRAKEDAAREKDRGKEDARREKVDREMGKEETAIDREEAILERAREREDVAIEKARNREDFELDKAGRERVRRYKVERARLKAEREKEDVGFAVNYNPDQIRDRAGKWTSGGNGGHAGPMAPAAARSKVATFLDAAGDVVGGGVHVATATVRSAAKVISRAVELAYHRYGNRGAVATALVGAAVYTTASSMTGGGAGLFGAAVYGLASAEARNTIAGFLGLIGGPEAKYGREMYRRGFLGNAELLHPDVTNAEADADADSSDTSHPDDPQETALFISEILYGLFGEDALAFIGVPPDGSGGANADATANADSEFLHPDVLNADCGTGTGGFKPGNTCAGQKRAQTGGEVGPNGEWYPGGAFIATTDLPKRVKDKIQKSSTGKVQVDGGRWEVPEPGQMSILDKLGGTVLNPRDGSVNHQYLQYIKATPEEVAEFEEIAQKWRDGERWISVNDYPRQAGIKDAARLVVSGQPVPGAVLDKLPPDWKSHLTKYKPTTNASGKWNPLHHPRGPHGRFIPKGSAEAVSAAKEAIGRAISGEKSSQSAEDIASHLRILTVKQLKEIHKEHGKTPPEGLRDKLFGAVLMRIYEGMEAEKGKGTGKVGTSHPDVPTELTGLRSGTRAHQFAQEALADGRLAYLRDRGVWAMGPYTGKTAGDVVNVWLKEHKGRETGKLKSEITAQRADELKQLNRARAAAGQPPLTRHPRDNNPIANASEEDLPSFILDFLDDFSTAANLPHPDVTREDVERMITEEMGGNGGGNGGGYVREEGIGDATANASGSNCGIGPGGFEEGNTCAKGGGGGGKATDSKSDHDSADRQDSSHPDVPKEKRGVVARIKEKIQEKYDKLEARYGRRGALAVLAGMAVMMPVPIPGAALTPIGIAEAILAAKKGVKKLTGNTEMDTNADSGSADSLDLDELTDEAIRLFKEVCEEAGEGCGEIDKSAVKKAIQKSLKDAD